MKIPSSDLSQLEEDYLFVDPTGEILALALEGPTSDLEDNIQLHSAADSGCHYFVTADEKLLKMKFFGKTKILSSLAD